MKEDEFVVDQRWAQLAAMIGTVLAGRGSISLTVYPMSDEPAPPAEQEREEDALRPSGRAAADMGGEGGGFQHGEEGLIKGPRPTLPSKFSLGQTVGFLVTNGTAADQPFLAVGEVRAITHFIYREPEYLLRPLGEGLRLSRLGHDHDVRRDEGEVLLVSATLP